MNVFYFIEATEIEMHKTKRRSLRNVKKPFGIRHSILDTKLDIKEAQVFQRPLGSFRVSTLAFRLEVQGIAPWSLTASKSCGCSVPGRMKFAVKRKGKCKTMTGTSN